MNLMQCDGMRCISHIKSQILLPFSYLSIVGQKMNNECFVGYVFIYLQLSKLKNLNIVKLFCH